MRPSRPSPATCRCPDETEASSTPHLEWISILHARFRLDIESDIQRNRLDNPPSAWDPCRRTPGQRKSWADSLLEKYPWASAAKRVQTSKQPRWPRRPP